VLFLAAFNVYFRDLQHIIPHLLLVLQFLTPIFYPLSLVPEPLRPWLVLNPLSPLITSFQNVLFFNQAPRWSSMIGLLLFTVLVLAVAVPTFARYKRTFAESL
jgi:ABC-type polysaccharide/polyol phosphate export permease